MKLKNVIINLIPETLNLKLATHNPQPITRNPQLSNPQLPSPD